MYEVLDFWAEWCGPCHAMKPILEEVEKTSAGKFKVTKIEVDQNQDQAAKYAVMSIPTYVVLKDGTEVDRKTGAMPKDRFVSWLNSVTSK